MLYCLVFKVRFGIINMFLFMKYVFGIVYIFERKDEVNIDIIMQGFDRLLVCVWEQGEIKNGGGY